MNPIATSLLVFACVFGGALLGMVLQAVLPSIICVPTRKIDVQRSLQAQALSLAIAIAQTRWLMFAQSANSVSVPQPLRSAYDHELSRWRPPGPPTHMAGR